MKGFDPRWRDLPHYILGITEEIWEGRNVGGLRHWYGPEMIKRAPAGIVVGATHVIDETVAALARVPDLLILGEDVIWSGDEEAGFLSSHRSTEVMTRTGADGRPVRVTERVVADCFCTQDRITDEWLAFDSGAVARQLGSTPEEAARHEIAAEGGLERAARPFHPRDDRPGPYLGRGNGGEWGGRYVALLEAVMAADLSGLARTYDRAATLFLPGGVTGHGVADADRFWLGLRSAFPTARLDVQHVISREDPLMPPRSAVRWSLTGAHDGPGPFGEPTGAEVHLMAFSHAEWGPRGLRREWVIWDEVQVWKQILLHTG